MDSLSAAAAKAATVLFSSSRNNALAGVAFAVLLLFAFTLHLSSGLLATAPANFVHFAALSVVMVVAAIAVLLVVAQHKSTQKAK